MTRDEALGGCLVLATSADATRHLRLHSSRGARPTSADSDRSPARKSNQRTSLKRFADRCVPIAAFVITQVQGCTVEEGCSWDEIPYSLRVVARRIRDEIEKASTNEKFDVYDASSESASSIAMIAPCPLEYPDVGFACGITNFFDCLSWYDPLAERVSLGARRLLTFAADPLCCGLPYRGEMTLGIGYGTGFVVRMKATKIAPERPVIVTARHVFKQLSTEATLPLDTNYCAVFGWTKRDGAWFPPGTVPASDVIPLTVIERGEKEDPNGDWAILVPSGDHGDKLASRRSLQLSRDVKGAASAVGHPLGTPSKLTLGELDPKDCLATLDIIDGFSGSPVFQTTPQKESRVVGLVKLNGAPDFHEDARDCVDDVRCDDSAPCAKTNYYVPMCSLADYIEVTGCNGS